MAPGGLPGASQEANFIKEAFLASLGALLGTPGALLGWSSDLLGRSFWPPGVHFSRFWGGILGGWARGL